MIEAEMISPTDGGTQAPLPKEAKAKADRAAWYLRHRDAILARQASPEQRAIKARCRNTPEGKAARKAYSARRNAMPEVKARQKIIDAQRRSTPEGIAALKTMNDNRYATPELRAKYNAGEVKRRQTPEAKARIKTYNATAGAKAAKAAYADTPEAKRSAKEKCAKRRALLAGATIGDPKSITAWETAWKKLKRVTCRWCHASIKPKDAHTDHIIPLKLHGPHSLENLCVSCAKCNQTKNAKLPEVWNATLLQPVLFL